MSSFTHKPANIVFEMETIKRDFCLRLYVRWALKDLSFNDLS
jgi:hypothetical protein